ncbi:hypothetical protein ElyMa_004386500 [Elysia marginata]|uniref:Uncharacterized protein n=1 Tax=Elysia marginata TaxID=1093978 RepID=A0AAV4H7W4_9GAST|nr:hypothetical protein ElyMa_004386500 [Elysia marginata]
MSVREEVANGKWLLPRKNAKDSSCGKKATLQQQRCGSPAQRCLFKKDHATESKSSRMIHFSSMILLHENKTATGPDIKIMIGL